MKNRKKMKKNMVAKGLIEKKNYTMVKNKAAVITIAAKKAIVAYKKALAQKALAQKTIVANKALTKKTMKEKEKKLADIKNNLKYLQESLEHSVLFYYDLDLVLQINYDTLDDVDAYKKEAMSFVRGFLRAIGLVVFARAYISEVTFAKRYTENGKVRIILNVVVDQIYEKTMSGDIYLVLMQHYFDFIYTLSVKKNNQLIIANLEDEINNYYFFFSDNVEAETFQMFGDSVFESSKNLNEIGGVRKHFLFKGNDPYIKAVNILNWYMQDNNYYCRHGRVIEWERRVGKHIMDAKNIEGLLPDIILWMKERSWAQTNATNAVLDLYENSHRLIKLLGHENSFLPTFTVNSGYWVMFNDGIYDLELDKFYGGPGPVIMALYKYDGSYKEFLQKKDVIFLSKEKVVIYNNIIRKSRKTMLKGKIQIIFEKNNNYLYNYSVDKDNVGKKKIELEGHDIFYSLLENKSANSIVITGDNLIAIARIYDYLPEFFLREIFCDSTITEDNKVEMILAALLGNVSREKEE